MLRFNLIIKPVIFIIFKKKRKFYIRTVRKIFKFFTEAKSIDVVYFVVYLLIMNVLLIYTTATFQIENGYMYLYWKIGVL